MKPLEAKPRSTLKRSITFDDSGISFDKELVLVLVVLVTRFSSGNNSKMKGNHHCIKRLPYKFKVSKVQR